ncbi:MAG: amidohydrolase, partial [Candidatus Hodarchaeota archaeon]
MKNPPIAIKGGILIDGTGKSPILNSMIVISGSKILDVGSVEEVDVPDDALVIEANGKTVIPSFIDSHTHFILMGVRTLTTLDLSKTKSIAEIVDRVKKRISELPNGSWITGHGWDESNWEEKRYPTKDDLDHISPDNPVVLTPYYGHLMVVNSRALKLAKVTKETSDPPSGKIDRNPDNNELTGILREEAMDLIEKVKPPMTEKIALAGVKKACEIVLSNGCASIHELESDAMNIRVYQTAFEKGLLKIRAYVMPEARFTEEMLDGLEVLGVRTQFGNDFLRIGSVKI